MSLQWSFNCYFLIELQFVEGETGKIEKTPWSKARTNEKTQPMDDARSWF